MKKLILILICFPIIILAQQTFIPGDNFENYLENNGMGNGIPNDDYVATANINTVTYLDVSNQNISDLTGIEDFQLLVNLYCNNNHLTSLDINNNNALAYLQCNGNQLTSLNVSNNTSLDELGCSFNNLTSLDVSNNIVLFGLGCSGNQIISLDLSNNPLLEMLDCSYNALISLDLRNGNNVNMSYFITISNPNLSCINVDDKTWSTNNWTVANQNIDLQQYFSVNCSFAGIEESKKDRIPIRIINLLGREIKPKSKTPLIYIYNNKTVEKRIIY